MQIHIDDLTSFSDCCFVIPCLNEEGSIAHVIKECLDECPGSRVVVCDNNSTDATAQAALEAGAQVIHETRPGKGYAVRHLFQNVNSKIVIMVDGDGTYDLSGLSDIIFRFRNENFDVASGNRLYYKSKAQYRPGHYLGNLLFCHFSSLLLGKKQYDIFSGLFIMTDSFLSSFPLKSRTFELEAELATHIARMDSRYMAFPVKLRKRLYGASKLRTFGDGSKILLGILKNSFTEFPLRIMSALFIVLFSLSIFLMYLPVFEYLTTGVVTYTPRLIVASSTLVLSFIFLVSALVLDSLSRTRVEARLFASRLYRNSRGD